MLHLQKICHPLINRRSLGDRYEWITFQLADIAECGLYYIYKDTKFKRVLKNPKKTVLNNLKATDAFLDKRINISGCVCNKLYHRRIIEKLLFPEKRLHEDTFFTYKALYFCTTYMRTESCKYNFIQERNGSIMTVRNQNIL